MFNSWLNEKSFSDLLFLFQCVVLLDIKEKYADLKATVNMNLFS